MNLNTVQVSVIAITAILFYGTLAYAVGKWLKKVGRNSTR